MGLNKTLFTCAGEDSRPSWYPEPDLPVLRDAEYGLVWITSNRVISWYDKRTSTWSVVGLWQGDDSEAERSL